MKFEPFAKRLWKGFDGLRLNGYLSFNGVYPQGGHPDHVLTLCTCNYISGYGRTILVCVPKSEANAATAATSATTTDTSTSAASSGTAG